MALILARASATCGKCLQACQDYSLCAQVQARAQRYHGSEAQSPPRPCADSAEQTGAATTWLGSSVSGASTSHRGQNEYHVLHMTPAAHATCLREFPGTAACADFVDGAAPWDLQVLASLGSHGRQLLA